MWVCLHKPNTCKSCQSKSENLIFYFEIFQKIRKLFLLGRVFDGFKRHHIHYTRQSSLKNIPDKSNFFRLSKSFHSQFEEIRFE
jgi:hypothetical protein